MSLQAPELLDPYEQFWDEAYRKAYGELTPPEREEAARIEKQGHTGDLVKVGVALGAAFLLHRRIMRRKLMQTAHPSNLKLAMTAAYETFTPLWVRLVVPALLSGYLIGAKEVVGGHVDQVYLERIAEGYARELGATLHETSADAVLNGYQSLINRKVPTGRALGNVLRAFGVTQRGMNALVNIWMGEDPKRLTQQSLAPVRDTKAYRAIESDTKARARMMAENEAWATRTMAKQIMWMYQVQHGSLPESAERVWVTRRDELVCPVCGPMHKVVVPITEQFKTDSGKFWSPPLHPRCRCDVLLRLPEVAVSKAFGRDPFDRDRHGRFAASEQRRAQHAVAFAVPPEVEEPEEETPRLGYDRPRLGQNPGIGRLGMSGAQLGMGGARPMLGHQAPQAVEEEAPPPVQAQVVERPQLGFAQAKLGHTPARLGQAKLTGEHKADLGRREVVEDLEEMQEAEQTELPPITAEVPEEAVPEVKAKPQMAKQYLDRAMFAFYTPLERQAAMQRDGTMLVPESLEFTDNYAAMDGQMRSYWADIFDSQILKEHIDENGMVPFEVMKNGQPVDVMIEPDVLYDAFRAEVDDEPTAAHQMVRAYDTEGARWWLTRTDVWTRFNMAEVIEENIPTVVVVHEIDTNTMDTTPGPRETTGMFKGTWQPGMEDRPFMKNYRMDLNLPPD